MITSLLFAAAVIALAFKRWPVAVFLFSVTLLAIGVQVLIVLFAASVRH